MTVNFKDIPVDIPEIPDAWMYHYYLKLKEPLDGRRIRVKSPFGSDRNPSMFLYTSGGKYRWKDFSSSKVGSNALSLVKEILDQTYGSTLEFRYAVQWIKDDYREWTEKHGEFIPLTLETEYFAYKLVVKYKKADYEGWDLQYWANFNIPPALLNLYNIYPLEWFQLGKENEHGTFWYTKKSFRYCYGFFDNEGDLIKIYNPYYEDFKHINFRTELMGREQLRGKSTLLLCSSMKDMLSVKSLSLDVDVAAPSSERVFLAKSLVDDLKNIYKNIFTMFDNDKAGVQAMMAYKKLYNLDYIYLPFEKDVAEIVDSTRDPLWVKHELVIRLNSKINA